MTIYDALNSATRRWMSDRGLTHSQAAPLLGLTRGSLESRLSNTRRWSVLDVVHLAEAGVILPDPIMGWAETSDQAS